jgi:hypothetical protein
VLVAGGVSVGFWEHHRLQAAEQARIAQQHQMELQRIVAEHAERSGHVARAEQKTREEEEQLLASVDSAVARQVPAAMEPLAELMAEDETR